MRIADAAPQPRREFPSREYMLTIYEAGSDVVVNTKEFNPKYDDSRKGAHGALDWAMAEGHDVTVEAVPDPA